MDLIFPGEFTRVGAEEHDGTLCRLEYHGHLMFAGTELELKGACWEWLIYSHLDDLSCSVGVPSHRPLFRKRKRTVRRTRRWQGSASWISATWRKKHSTSTARDRRSSTFLHFRRMHTCARA